MSSNQASGESNSEPSPSLRESVVKEKAEPERPRIAPAAVPSSHLQQLPSGWTNYNYNQQRRQQQQPAGLYSYQYPPSDGRRLSTEGYPPTAYPLLGYGGYQHPYPQQQYHFYGYPSFHPQLPQGPLSTMKSSRNSLGSIGSIGSLASGGYFPPTNPAVPPTAPMRDYSRRYSTGHQGFHPTSNTAPASERPQQARAVDSRTKHSHQKKQLKQTTETTHTPATGAFQSPPTSTIKLAAGFSSPPPTTLNVPLRKNRDSIGSTLSRESIGHFSVGAAQLDSFDLDLKSPTSMVFSALLHGASIIATVDRPDEEVNSPISHLEDDNAADDRKDFAATDKENNDTSTCMRKPKKKSSEAPRAKRALLSVATNNRTRMELVEALANPIGAIEIDSELRRQIVILMALQRDNVSSVPGIGGKTKPLTTTDAESKIMHPGFFWRDYPPLETVLYDSMKEYYEHSNSSGRTKGHYKEQQAYNNSLVETIRHVAAEHKYHMGHELINSDKHLRDRIRCFYKTHIQNAKKRLATMMKQDKSPTMKAHLRAMVRSIIQKIPLEQAISHEKSILHSPAPKFISKTDEKGKHLPHLAENRKRDTSGSSSSSANTAVGMVDRPPSVHETNPSAPVVPHNIASSSLPPFKVQNQEISPFLNLENDAVIAACAVSTRNVAFQGNSYPYPPPSASHLQYPRPPNRCMQQQPSYFPPAKKPRLNSTPASNSRVPTPLAFRQAK